MALNLKAAAHSLALLRRMPSAAFLLQAAACAVVAWSLWHGGLTQPPAALPAAAPPVPAAAESAAAGGAPATPSAPTMTLAAATPLADARAALSAVDVIVTRNDTLDRIFRRWKLNLSDLASMRSLPGVRANLDSLRPGELLHLWHKDGQLFGLERRLNESQTLKVSRDGDQLKADVVQNALDARSRTVRGRIDSSLFEAVEAAEFVNQGREVRAVRYTDPDGDSHYYTPDGRSMHKAFLRAPVEFTRVSSRFNSARLHPILNRIRAHKGVDYAAPIGTPVKAAGDGSIRFAGVLGGYGNVVEIEHSRSVMTVYGHLSRFAHGTRVGAHVAQGTVIAYVGMTGLATGPHLHYEYRVNGVFKNPQTVPLPSAAPIDARYRDDFLARTAPLLATLDVPQGPMLVAR